MYSTSPDLASVVLTFLPIWSDGFGSHFLQYSSERETQNAEQLLNRNRNVKYVMPNLVGSGNTMGGVAVIDIEFYIIQELLHEYEGQPVLHQILLKII